MEKRYRGYPPEVKKVPWMLYRREEQSAGPVLTGNELRSEMDYLRGIYPSAAKRKQVLAEEACDLLEYPGSPMYDEYPDRVLLYKVSADIYDKAVPLEQTEHRRGRRRDRDLMDVIQVLLFDEMHRRRGRRRRCCQRWW